ncbi:MAG TPA: immunoglobulin domain-containing protein, partial [Saprospiraceae bacterium]|nr:immunoglobulin domain-containing protein [Saprospiraceae bacterium]
MNYKEEYSTRFINGNVFTSRPINITDDYFIQVRDGLRCDTIIVSGSPNCVPCRPAGASASSNAPICEGERLQFNANGGASYQWSGPNGFSSTEQNPFIDSVFTALHSGEYTVIIADINNCRDT